MPSLSLSDAIVLRKLSIKGGGPSKAVLQWLVHPYVLLANVSKGSHLGAKSRLIPRAVEPHEDLAPFSVQPYMTVLVGSIRASTVSVVFGNDKPSREAL